MSINHINEENKRDYERPVITELEEVGEYLDYIKQEKDELEEYIIIDSLLKNNKEEKEQ